MSYEIRVYGDPVLRQVAAAVEEIDGRIARMVEDMIPAMHAAEGIGLAAPQVGIQKRLFVYDIGEGPRTLVNPEIVESDGEWAFEEGCLSVPGLSFACSFFCVSYSASAFVYSASRSSMRFCSAMFWTAS